MATYSIVKVLGRSHRLGRILLWAAGGFAVSDLLLAYSHWFGLAILAALGVGVADALATSIRHAAVQTVTPDRLRGRVSSIYQVSSRGGPAGITLSYVAAMLARDNPVRRYTGPDRTHITVV